MFVIFGLCLGLTSSAGFLQALYAQPPSPLNLPEPQIDGGKPLMQALKERKSLRSYSTRKLPLQVLSNLLWAAWGVNRPAAGLRTAPTAHNALEIEVYAALEEGLYFYDARSHKLDLLLDRDVRLDTATVFQQGYVAPAPINLIYVCDTGKMTESFCYEDAGSISQNVYLFCASQGLATVVRGAIPQGLAGLMDLPPNKIVTLVQTVGYPRNEDQQQGDDHDANGDSIIDVTSVIVDMDRNDLISAGDAYTHTYEDGATVEGVIEQKHIDWLLADNYALDAAGLQAAANAVEDDPRRWLSISLVLPNDAGNCLQCHSSPHFSGDCLQCHSPHLPLPPDEFYECLQCHLPHLFNSMNCLQCHIPHSPF